MAFDSRNGRVTVLDPEGRAASMFGLREATNVEGAVTLEGTTRDGLLLASRIHARDADADGYRRDEVEFMVTARAAGDPERLGRFPGRELEYRESSPAPGMITTQQASIPFARSALGVAGADGVFVGSNDTFEVHAFSSDGSLRRIIRRSDAARREVDRGVLEAFVDAALDASPQAGSSPDRAALLGAVLERPRVPSMPTFDRLHVDDAGRLWVREYAVPWESGSPGRWSVFGPQGSLDAVAETPPGLDVYHIGDAYLLGVATNDLGVEEVRMYELQSAPGGSR